MSKISPKPDGGTDSSDDNMGDKTGDETGSGKLKPAVAAPRGSGVHWFVAWRYLLERDTRWSPAIMFVVAVSLWVAVSFFIVGNTLFPLADRILSPFRPAPWWLLCGLALFTVGAIACPVLAAIRVGIKGLSGTSLATSERPDSLPLFVAGMISGLIAIDLLGLFGYFYRPFMENEATPVPILWIVIAGVVAALVLIAVPWWVSTLGRRNTKKNPSTWARIVRDVVFLALVCVGAMALASVWGLRDVVFEQLLSRFEFLPLIAGASTSGLVANVAIVVAIVVVFGFVFRALGSRSVGRGVAMAGSIAMASAAVTILLFLHQTALAGMPQSSSLAVKVPQEISTTVIGALALGVLALVLFAVRARFTFFSTVSIGGVAIGTMALVIALSVMSGFESDLRNKILGSNAHILVTKASERQPVCRVLKTLSWHRCKVGLDRTFTEYRPIGKSIEAVSEVIAQSPYLLSEVVVAANSNYGNVIIKGIDPETVGDVSELRENVTKPDGTVDAEALDRLWPLAEDASVIGKPMPGADALDPSDPTAPKEGDPNVDDPAPDDQRLPNDPAPIDFGQGSEPDSEAAPSPTDTPADFGAADRAPADFGAAVDVLADNDVGGPVPTDFSASGDGSEDDALELNPDPLPGLLGQGNPSSSQDNGKSGSAIPIYQGSDILFDDDAVEYVRHIPPLVAILPGLMVGKELIKGVPLGVGQEVKVISPLGQDTPLGPVPRTKRFRVAGIFFTGMYEYDLKFVYVELGALQDFLDLGDEVTGIEIRIADPTETGAVVSQLAASLGPEYRIQDWKELNRSLFSALKLEKIAMFLILAIIILVASFSIVGNLIMVVVEKSRDIAVLKTLGTSDRGVLKIFITQGFFIGLVGTTLGVSLGLIASLLMQVFGLRINPDVYYIDTLPVHIEPLSVALVFAAGLVISVIATLYPAYIAARMRPVNGLRYE